ncbi:F0F1 ATP synthase subunit B [Helicobacter labetoulli]|uniref:F0F1 ATP synthase subunit B n=1 Tax=Helicobacter labetoulli TaxID=2315333 RepID=UPI001FC908DD|nr:F0F1 ATP synthase subunit B [Helicobacter labetoulli]
MMRKFLYCALLVAFPSLLLASASIENSDFIPRVINFVIFIAILWYFAFDSVKGIFITRKKAIAARLQEVQDNLHKAKQERENAQKRLEESKEKAKEIVNSAKQEEYLIRQKYDDQIKKDIELLKSALEANIEFEHRKAVRTSVENLLNELTANKNLQLNKEDYVNIITKRIS